MGNSLRHVHSYSTASGVPDGAMKKRVGEWVADAFAEQISG
jgi:hypothetical protein